MKIRFFTLRKVILSFSIAVITIFFIQCKKEGDNASALDRSVAASNLDSTIFTPFYDTTVLKIATTQSVNDVIATSGIQSIIKNNCATAGCHGGGVSPSLLTYAQIKSLVTPGNPEASKLWNLLTTHDLNKAMPPVNTNPDVSIDQKVAIYNWIKNGANEFPSFVDYRTSAIRIITGGCTAQCHNEGIVVGTWSKSYNFGRPLTSNDTMTAIYKKLICINDTLTARVWGRYKDSVSMFYADTIKNLAYNPAFAKPGSSSLPLNNYQDILFLVSYPNRNRSNKNPMYNMTSAGYSLLTKVDSTLLLVNAQSGSAYKSGNMAYQDGHLTPSEIAIIKSWYFLDSNIPDKWKYGPNNQGIFKDMGGNMIIKKTN